MCGADGVGLLAVARLVATAGAAGEGSRPPTTGISAGVAFGCALGSMAVFAFKRVVPLLPTLLDFLPMPAGLPCFGGSLFVQPSALGGWFCDAPTPEVRGVRGVALVLFSLCAHLPLRTSNGGGPL